MPRCGGSWTRYGPRLPCCARWGSGDDAAARWLGVVLVALLALTPMALGASDRFEDVPDNAFYHADATALANANVTLGCFDTQHFCPNDTVTRGQMAAFLARLGGLGTNPPVVNAATALTATNASQLGGVAAAAYAQKGQFKGGEVLDATGPLPKAGSFTSTGGTLLVFVSGSAYRNVPGLLQIELDITGPANVNNATVLSVFTNEGNSHKAFPSEVEVLTNLPAGTYTFTLRASAATTITDGSDRYTISVLEIPKP